VRVLYTAFVLALQFFKELGCPIYLLYARFRNKKLFLRGWVVSTTPNPQPGGPVSYT